MIEHIQQLRGESPADALVNAKACKHTTARGVLPPCLSCEALVSYYSGSFGFAAFYDAAQNRTRIACCN